MSTQLVKDLILYQVATDRNYKVGDVFYFGDNDNYQAYRVLNSRLCDEDDRLAKQGYNYSNSKKILKDKKLIDKLSRAIDESDFVIREMATEYVRRNSYKDKPSRLKCMFLIDNKEDCLKACKTFYKKGHGTFFQAVAVKVSGKIFYAKDIVMPRDGLSFSEYMEIAEKYWSQNQDSVARTQEILFEGKAEIVEILDEIKIQ